VPGWKDYITGRKAHYAAKNAAKLALDKRQEQERKQLAEQQRPAAMNSCAATGRARAKCSTPCAA
jgi:hypothetical protein